MNREQAIQALISLFNEIDGSRFPDEGFDGETIWSCTVEDKTFTEAMRAKDVLTKKEDGSNG